MSIIRTMAIVVFLHLAFSHFIVSDSIVRIFLLVMAARANGCNNGFRYCPDLEHLVDFVLLVLSFSQR